MRRHGLFHYARQLRLGHFPAPAPAHFAAECRETWRQNHLLLPAMYGLDSEEELMKRLVAAQYAADQAKLWSEPERMPLVESYLRREAP